MSMNMFFVSCTDSELNAMSENPSYIDEFLESENFEHSMDIESAWDVLRVALDGTGIEVGKEIPDALFNGCNLISSEDVKAQALKLSHWSKEEVLEKLRAIDDPEIYHLDIYQEDEDNLFEHFEAMLNFYKEAADKGLCAISYVA